MGWMAIWSVLGIVVIAFVLLWAVLAGSRGRNGSIESPEDTLKRRYAKGEIDRETYQRMLRDLRAG